MTVLCSGGFDPLHDGHINYLEAASEYGRVIIALNSDAWLTTKKGWVFMPWSARERVLSALLYDVVPVFDIDGTVCEALQKIRPAYFANGGDREKPNLAEHELCRRLGIEELFGIGGPKVRSSSDFQYKELRSL